jgi:hypothetical protein
MAITAGDVITKAREYLSDDNEIKVFSDAVMIASLNRGQLALIKDRPELKISATGTESTYTAATSTSDTLLWPDDFLEALAQYIAYDRLSDDSHNRANREEAIYRLELYKSEIS